LSGESSPSTLMAQLIVSAFYVGSRIAFVAGRLQPPARQTS
jgi:hypothetical protein